MSNSNILKYKVLIVPLFVIGVGFFFFRMYQNDVKALADFSVSYEKFDKAVSDFALNKTDGNRIKADDALIDLKTKAVFKLSSLIKNDNLIPPAAVEVADSATQELADLKTAENPDPYWTEN